MLALSLPALPLLHHPGSHAILNRFVVILTSRGFHTAKTSSSSNFRRMQSLTASRPIRTPPSSPGLPSDSPHSRIEPHFKPGRILRMLPANSSGSGTMGNRIRIELTRWLSYTCRACCFLARCDFRCHIHAISGLGFRNSAWVRCAPGPQHPGTARRRIGHWGAQIWLLERMT